MEVDQDHVFDRNLTPELSRWAEEARKQNAQYQATSLAVTATQCHPQDRETPRHAQPDCETPRLSVPEQHKRCLVAQQPDCYSGQPVFKRLRPIERAHPGWGPFDDDGHRL